MKSTKVPKRIREALPQVTKVRDADSTINITVLPKDSAAGRRRDPNNCALARACVREKIADAAVIGIGSSWLIKGNVATRYLTSEAVSREITSFDRHHDFAAGQDYKLSRIPPAKRLGKKEWPKTGPHIRTKIDASAYHHTANIRVIRKYK